MNKTKVIKKLVLSGVFLTLSVTSASADFLNGLIAMRNQNYDDAFKEFTADVAAGDSRAYFYLGYLYYHGAGTAQDYTRAHELLQKAANAPYEAVEIDTWMLLGESYQNGNGVSMSTKTALKWYEKAAERESDQAAYLVGLLLRDGGNDLEADPAGAAMAWGLPARRGHEQSMISLARLYEDGMGVEQNLDRAFSLYLMAAEERHPNAMMTVAYYYRDSEAHRNYGEAAKWFDSAGAMGNGEAHYELALMYYDGLGVAQDREEAVVLTYGAAEKGSINAANAMGAFYTRGEYIEKDDAAALEYFLSAASRGHSAAQRNAANAYFNGLGTEQDMVSAAAWLLLAATSDPARNEGARDAVMGRLSEAEQNQARQLAQTLLVK